MITFIFRFETSHSRNSPMSQSLPIQRNLSSYENFDTSSSTEANTPEVSITDTNYENLGRMDEIGIPVFDEISRNELSSPLMIRKLQNQSPIGSPYENVYYKNSIGFKPKSPNTHSPRTRIKTSFAHKNLPSPQYFIFPTPPIENNSKFPFGNDVSTVTNTGTHTITKTGTHTGNTGADNRHITDFSSKDTNCGGIEKQLSLEEEIPMIDDADLTNDIEFRYSKVIDKNDDSIQESSEIDRREGDIDYRCRNVDRNESNDVTNDTGAKVAITKNKSFDDVKNELMADIPELEEFEKELKQNKR